MEHLQEHKRKAKTIEAGGLAGVTRYRYFTCNKCGPKRTLLCLLETKIEQ